MAGPPENDICSICHGSFDVPCQSNCSHWFCAHCIMTVWRHGSTFHPCRCPLCRRRITLLIPTDAILRRRHEPFIGSILERVETYNRIFGGTSSSLFQKMQDLPFLLRRLLKELMDPQRSLPLVIRARVYIAVKSLRNHDFQNFLHCADSQCCLHIQPYRHYPRSGSGGSWLIG